jgi:ribosomal protein L11 methyltransferase
VDGDGYVEYALYGAPGELPSFPAGEAEVGGMLVSVRGEEVADDWADRWKRFHEPALIGDRVFVRPPWSEPRAGTLDVVIDPGRAFGTGAHPTTRLSLELLLALAGGHFPGGSPGTRPGGSFADLGCGSGVLAIAAARLGFAPVVALDQDTAALDATRANAAANGVALDRIERANLRERPAPAAETVAANLTRGLLLRVAELIPEPPFALIASGMLDDEADAVAAAFAPLDERRRLSSAGWSASLLTR